jgi:hypothetical protein
MTDQPNALLADLPPLYYLSNFHSVLDWVASRYGDLLNTDEQQFLTDFAQLSTDSQALLVRLIMRQRPIVRVNSLQYAEISHIEAALHALHARAWITFDIDLPLDSLFVLATKAELLAELPADEIAHFGLHPRQSKTEMRLSLEPLADNTRPWAGWLPGNSDQLITLTCRELTDRIRLLFFGSPYHDWSTFVVADLGHIRYEQVAMTADSRAFQTRIDIDTYDWLLSLQQRLAEGEAIATVWTELEQMVAGCSSVITARQHKAQFQLGQAAEKQQDWLMAMRIYAACRYRGSRHRLMRVHEKLAQWPEAYALAQAVLAEPSSEQERQSVQRALPRLAKKCGAPAPNKSPALLAVSEHILSLEQAPDTSVEWAACSALQDADVDVYYVENTLFSSLFGLLYWPAIFAPVPGAFYHPYHSGPADLHHPSFAEKRAELLQDLTATLNTGAYRERIAQCFAEKHGIANPFVFWAALTPERLEQALICLPAKSLKAVFTRMLADLKSNRSGFPDLISMTSRDALAQGDTPQFRLIEVKGPNDTLQDNQARWMDFFIRHDMPCELLHLRWPAPQ